MEHGTPWVEHSHAISMLPHVHANLHMPFAELDVASTFKYDFRVPVYSSSTSSLLVNSISMSLVLKCEGKELSNKRNKLRNKRVNLVLMSME